MIVRSILSRTFVWFVLFVHLISCSQYEHATSDSFTGRIEHEQFAYFSVDSPSDLQFVLTSLEGDCDLYVTKQDTLIDVLDIKSYTFHSRTCGEDVLVVAKDQMARPFRVGIYCYWAEPPDKTCEYQIRMDAIQATHITYEDIDRVYNSPENNLDDHEQATADMENESSTTFQLPQVLTFWKSYTNATFFEMMFQIFIEILELLFV